MRWQKVGHEWAHTHIPLLKHHFTSYWLHNSFILGCSQSVQKLSCIWLFVTPWTATHQASLSITNSQSLLKLMSIVLLMPFSHLILCRPFILLPSIFPSIRVFPMSRFFTSGGQSIGASASASVLPVNIQDWFPLGQVWSPCSPRDSQESSPTP